MSRCYNTPRCCSKLSSANPPGCCGDRRGPRKHRRAALTIRRVTTTGAGVTVEHAKLSGDITIEDVQAGHQGGTPKRLEAAGFTPAAQLQFDHITVGDFSLRGVTIQQYFGTRAALTPPAVTGGP